LRLLDKISAVDYTETTVGREQWVVSVTEAELEDDNEDTT